MKKIITLILLLPFFSYSQIDTLRPEFKNVSWIMDSKVTEIVSTLSYHFKDESLMETDTDFVSQKDYNLYYDSLSLWYITKDAYTENDTNAAATSVGDFVNDESGRSVGEWLRIYENSTMTAYNSVNSTKNQGCIPSSYDNLKLFYKLEDNRITSYNSSRIKVYEYSENRDSVNTINYFLAFHKYIKPNDTYAIKFYNSGWTPFMYFYPEPKHKVYPASVEKMWEIHTGLPYKVAKDLSLNDSRILKILPSINDKNVNNDVLIKKAYIELDVDEVYNIDVTCDTCEIKIYDSKAEDGDIIDFTYKELTNNFKIINSGTEYEIILTESDYFLIYAVSEGALKTCTVYITIDNNEYTFALKKDERIKIKLNKS